MEFVQRGSFEVSANGDSMIAVHRYITGCIAAHMQHVDQIASVAADEVRGGKLVGKGFKAHGYRSSHFVPIGGIDGNTVDSRNNIEYSAVSDSYGTGSALEDKVLLHDGRCLFIAVIQTAENFLRIGRLFDVSERRDLITLQGKAFCIGDKYDWYGKIGLANACG